jgi:hypothetical protein
MAVAFARTIRSLNTNDFRGPRLVWILAAIILAVWTWWFFTAQIPLSTNSGSAGAPTMERDTPARVAWRSVRRTLKPAQ